MRGDGLCDAVGMGLFLDCVLYLYGQRSGLLKEEDPIPALYEERVGRTCPLSLAQLSEQALDPYGFLVKEYGLLSTPAPVEGDALFIQRQKDLVESARVHVFSVHTETEAFLSLSKEMGVSFTALLIPLVCQAVARGCKAKDGKVRVMMPVNLRQVYDVETLVNFSDGMSFESDEAVRREPLPAQAKQYLKRLKALMSRTYFDQLLLDKVKTVQAFDAAETPVEEAGPRPRTAPAGGKHTPYTCVLTYPRRKQEFSFLEGVSYCCGVSTSLTVVAYTWQNQMTIRCIQKSDSDAIVKALARCLEEAGLPAGTEDEGCLEGDILLLSRLLKR